MKHMIKHVTIIAVICLMLILLCNTHSKVESFHPLYENKKNISNPYVKYNLNILKQNVSSNDIKHYLNTQQWQWNKDTKHRYIKALDRNPYIRRTSELGLAYAQHIYPEYAINYILDQEIESNNKREELEEAKKMHIKKIYPKGIGLFGFNSGLF